MLHPGITAIGRAQAALAPPWHESAAVVAKVLRTTERSLVAVPWVGGAPSRTKVTT